MSHNSTEEDDQTSSGGGGGSQTLSESADGQTASSSSENKIYVCGLTPETTSYDLRDYFQQFGTVTRAHVLVDKITKSSCLVGFVSFKEASSVSKVLDVRYNHFLDGKFFKVEFASPKVGTKLFVHGVSQETSVNELKAFFSRFGKVLEVILPSTYPGTNKIHRGYSFVTFESADVVECLRKARFLVLNGKKVKCFTAYRKEPSPQSPPIVLPEPQMALVQLQQQQMAQFQLLQRQQMAQFQQQQQVAQFQQQRQMALVNYYYLGDPLFYHPAASVKPHCP